MTNSLPMRFFNLLLGRKRGGNHRREWSMGGW